MNVSSLLKRADEFSEYIRQRTDVDFNSFTVTQRQDFFEAWWKETQLSKGRYRLEEFSMELGYTRAWAIRADSNGLSIVQWDYREETPLQQEKMMLEESSILLHISYNCPLY